MPAGPTGEPDTRNMVRSVPTTRGEVGPQNRVQNKTRTEQAAVQGQG